MILRAAKAMTLGDEVPELGNRSGEGTVTETCYLAELRSSTSSYWQMERHGWIFSEILRMAEMSRSEHKSLYGELR